MSWNQGIYTGNCNTEGPAIKGFQLYWSISDSVARFGENCHNFGNFLKKYFAFFNLLWPLLPNAIAQLLL